MDEPHELCILRTIINKFKTLIPYSRIIPIDRKSEILSGFKVMFVNISKEALDV